MKTQNIDISIIVPIYNSEKYIKKCIDSLLNQTLESIEIILINDGSTDNSEKIIKKYNDKRIKYYKKENQGIGKTRNFGIENARGEYIMFIDSDDYISLDCCEIFLKNVREFDADMGVSDFYKDYSGNIKVEKMATFNPSSLKKNNDLILKINLGPCNKIYKRDLVVENKIYFNEEYKYEDVPFVAKCIKYANKICKVNKPLSYYCIHNNSETTIRDKRIFDILKQVEILREEFKDIDNIKENIDILTVNIITNYTIQQRYQKDRKIRNRFIEECFNYMKKNIPNFKHKKYYKGKHFFRRQIEKNMILTKIYCTISRLKYK